MIVSSTKSREI